MTVRTMNRKAATVGLSIRKGYQRYLRKGGGYFRDASGDRVIGYEVYDYRGGFCLYPSYSGIYDHALDLEEATQLLKDACMDEDSSSNGAPSGAVYKLSESLALCKVHSYYHRAFRHSVFILRREIGTPTAVGNRGVNLPSRQYLFRI